MDQLEKPTHKEDLDIIVLKKNKQTNPEVLCSSQITENKTQNKNNLFSTVEYFNNLNNLNLSHDNLFIYT